MGKAETHSSLFLPRAGIPNHLCRMLSIKYPKICAGMNHDRKKNPPTEKQMVAKPGPRPNVLEFFDTLVVGS